MGTGAASGAQRPTLTADVEGDGKGEFVVGFHCIGTDADGEGEIRWQSPAYIGWGAIADFTGDGRGEIACPSSGLLRVLRAQP